MLEKHYLIAAYKASLSRKCVALGEKKEHSELYRGAEYTVDFLPKVRMEIAASDQFVDQVVESIEKTANTGQVGDGKIFVLELEQAIRILTSEKQDEAL